MRYAVFSDVHSNLEAFEAVLKEFKGLNIDRYLFLGDIVGYGADPKKCIQLLKQLDTLSVAGNHDWAAVGMTDIDYFNEAARAAVLWTRENIAESDRLFLSGLELVKSEKKCRIVHGTLSHPEEFDYMVDGYRAMKTFYLLGEKICFVGHSHVPGVFTEDEEKISYQEPAVLRLEENKRYIVNDGSVGQPRDSDPRACFCVYDEEALKIEFKRVAYDISAAQKKILAGGLPRTLAERLKAGH